MYIWQKKQLFLECYGLIADFEYNTIKRKVRGIPWKINHLRPFIGFIADKILCLKTDTMLYIEGDCIILRV